MKEVFSAPGFSIRTLAWTLVLISVPGGIQILGGLPLSDGRTAWEVAFLLTAWVGLFLPFAAFAGGLGAPQVFIPIRMGLSGLGICMVSLLLSGFAAPHLQYRADISREKSIMNYRRVIPAKPNMSALQG